MVKGENIFCIEIEDKVSGLDICRVEMNPVEFAEAITGLAFAEGVAVFTPSLYSIERYGKKKQVERVKIPITDKLPKDTPESWFLQYVPDGWELWSDGLSTQQNKHGFHTIVICRYVELNHDDD